MKPSVAKVPVPAGLPKALRPWSETFQHMPEGNLRLLGGLMGQLNTFLRETFEIDTDSMGEFNGYDGMALRGEVERLMPSEWLWKDIVPEEFLRRFAEQELMYHKPSFESPTDERTHLIALDCGPNLLGRPRLVALAAMLSLKAIAQSHGANVLWVAPQDGIADWKGLLSQEDIKSFLLSANPVSLTNDQLMRVVEDLPDAPKDKDIMLWTVSASALATENDDIKTNQIIVTERMSFDGDGTPVAEADVILETYLGRQKKVVLHYPPENECVGLLREPFRVPRVREDRPRIEGGQVNTEWAGRPFIIDERYNRLVIRTRQGLLLATLNRASGLTMNPGRLKLEDYDHLLGVVAKNDKVTIATIRIYNGFSQVSLKRYTFPSTGSYSKSSSLVDIETIQVSEDICSEMREHSKHACVPLIKPGSKFRFIHVGSDGRMFVINRNNVVGHHLRSVPLVGHKNNWAYIVPERKENPERYLVARNLATSQVLSFRISEDAEVYSSDDLIHWPETFSTGEKSVVLTRCTDGFWRGWRSIPNVGPENRSEDDFIELDLPRGILPVGYYNKLRGEAPQPAYRFVYYDPDRKGLFYCGFTLVGRVDIEKLYDVPEALDGAVLYGDCALGWEVDEDGFLTMLHRYALSEAGDQTVHSVSIDELEKEALCLSD